MLRCQKRNLTKGFLPLVLVALLAFQLVPNPVSADGPGSEPPPAVTDTTQSGTRCVVGDGTSSQTLITTVSLLDVILMLAPLL